MSILEKLKEFLKNYKIPIIIISGCVALSIVITAVIVGTHKPGEGIYELLVSTSGFFDPILKGLAGIALIKYILLVSKCYLNKVFILIA